MKRDELVNDLRKMCDKLAFNEVVNSAVAKYNYDTYNVPMGRTKDLISDRINLHEESNAHLFFLTDSIDHVQNRNFVSKYFIEAEIKEYSKEKYTEGKLEYPLEINCIEVHAGKQWIGAIDTKFLMELKRAGKIRYNADKQRTRKKIIKEDTVIFKNFVKERSVNQIANLMLKNEYIPDDITLDIPSDVEGNKYYYDEDRSALIFDNIETLDITDGYHRFLAICKCVDKNPSFNYPMELRITVFTEQRSRQFIYQKDQKNKMTVSNSKSMDMFRPSNEICTQLNERGSGCSFSGLIQRNSGTVDFAALSDIVEYYWIRPIKKKDISNKEIMEITNEVKVILNGFVNEDVNFLENRYLSFDKLVVLFWLVKEKEKTPEKAVQILNKIEKNGEIKKVRLRYMRKTLFDILETLDY